jgi:hypothetical protein
MDFEIRISPLHPDGVGGLGAIGQLLTGSALIATIFGAVSAGMIIASQATNRAPFQRAETIALLILYTLLLPLLFAFWLWAPHQAQLRARGKALQPLTDEYQRALAETLPTPEAGAEALEKRTKRLEAIQAQYKLIKLSFPVWPLPAEQLTRLTAITSLPAISPFLTGLVGSILKFIVSQFGAPSP